MVTYHFRERERKLRTNSFRVLELSPHLISLKFTSLGSPHNLRRKKSVSETTIPGGKDSAPRGFVGTNT